MTFFDKLKNNKLSAGSVIIPWLAFIAAIVIGNVVFLDYVHVLTGAIWTGSDIFLSIILGRVVKTLGSNQKVSIAKNLIPMTMFYIPSTSLLTPGAGLYLAMIENAFSSVSVQFIYSLIALGVVLVAISFLVILPSSYRILKADEKDSNDANKIIKNLGYITTFAGIQMILQIIMIGFMAVFVVY
ncbi:hypothetical protein [Caldiplasma sukawensis]